MKGESGSGHFTLHSSLFTLHNESVPAIPSNRIPLLVTDRLESHAREVHRTYFFKYPPLPMRWGQQISRKKRRSTSGRFSIMPAMRCSPQPGGRGLISSLRR